MNTSNQPAFSETASTIKASDLLRISWLWPWDISGDSLTPNERTLLLMSDTSVSSLESIVSGGLTYKDPPNKREKTTL